MAVTVNNALRWDYCPLCSSTEIEKKYKEFRYNKPTFFSTTEVDLQQRGEVWECRSCQSKFIQNIVSETVAIELYSSGDSEQRWTAKPFAAEKTSDLLGILDTLFLPDKRILDIGCSTGNLLDLAKEKGCLTYGVEYSTRAVAFAKSKGHQVESDIEKIEGPFDIITAFDVVEHLYDPTTFFSKVVSLLRDNGQVVLLTGNPQCQALRLVRQNWWYFNLPEHVIFPSRLFLQTKLKELQLELYHETFNSRAYTPKGMLGFVRMIFYFLLKYRKYVGIPSKDPDHALIILKKKLQS